MKWLKKIDTGNLLIVSLVSVILFFVLILVEGSFENAKKKWAEANKTEKDIKACVESYEPVKLRDVEEENPKTKGVREETVRDLGKHGLTLDNSVSVSVTNQ